MTNRIIEIANGPARLSVRNECLIIERDGLPSASVPLPDIAVLVLANPSLSISHAVLAGMCEKGGMVVCCDNKHLPAGMLLPLQAHFLQAERFGTQARAPVPLFKRLWQQIVRAKIKAQARLLEESSAVSESGFLPGLLDRVRSGDTSNVEAQAARYYWQRLFGAEFRRDPEREDQNRFLNYGYAILRAIVCRAICAAGLHPSIGLHHHNRYNPFCLADDLMEPYRPLADAAALACVKRFGASAPFSSEIKQSLLLPMTGRFSDGVEVRTLFDWLARSAQSLADAIEEGTPKFSLSELRAVAETENIS